MRSRSVPRPDRRLVLTERDHRLLRRVYLHRALALEHVIGMGFFGSVPRANFRLRLLFDHGYLRRTHLAAGPYASKAVYLPGLAAAEWVARELELPLAEVARQTRKDPARTFLEHSLACADLRLEIERAAVRSGLSVGTYLPEPLCRHEYVLVGRGGSERRVLKPDGYVTLGSSHGTLRAFLEVDLGHVSSRQMARSLAHYASYLEGGLYREAYDEEGFEVLVVTSAGPGRVSNLARLARGCTRPQVRLTTFDLVRERGFEGAAWTVPGVRGLSAMPGWAP